ncbi:ABC transporter ATP-binding protein [Okibacterium endophyticum]
MTTPLLEVRDLTVRFGARTVVDAVSFSVQAGECVAIVGESGSGKSVTARSIVGLAGPGASVSAAALTVSGTDVITANASALRRLRGGEVGMIAQDALVSLDPLRPVGREISDTLALHTRLNASDRMARVHNLLENVGLEQPALRARQRAGELSGGQRQRALIASGIAAQPRLLVADEPTTALDRSVEAGILRLLADLRDEGTGILLVSHDLSVVRSVADRVVVMTSGLIVEEGPTARVLENPEHPYTRRLLAAVPSGKPRGTALSAGAGGSPSASHRAVTSAAEDSGDNPVPVPPPEVLLQAEKLSRTFWVHGTAVVAAHNVSLALSAGRTLGLVGESGSGKTTIAKMILGLEQPDGGSIALLGEPWTGIRERERRRRRGMLGAVFQDPASSFDPRWSVGSIIADAVTGGRSIRPRTVERAVRDALDAVGLHSSLMTARPRTLSGGQRQRVAIARALAVEPRVLVLDEPVSALDLSIQAQVLDLLDELQRERGLAYLLISHDLGVIEHMSDEITVMRLGSIVEHGATADVLRDPQHPYTRHLLDTRASVR